MRSRSVPGGFGDEPGHHVVGSVAMLFMLAADHPTGHEAHVAPAMPGIAPVAAIALTGYFAWHVLRCADRCRTTVPVAAGGAPAGSAAGSMALPAFSLRAPQTAAAGDLVLAASMAAMLLGMSDPPASRAGRVEVTAVGLGVPVKSNMFDQVVRAVASYDESPIRPVDQLSSMNFRIEVWSVRVWSTKFTLLNGEITWSGRRGP